MSVHAVKLVVPSPMHVVIDHSPALPSPLRVLIENPPSSPLHVLVDPSGWTTSDIITLVVAGGTLLLALAAIAALIANDLATQEQTLPHCDLEGVNEYSIEDGELHLGFTLRNDGTGPAREVRLHLEHYAGEKVGE